MNKCYHEWKTTSEYYAPETGRLHLTITCPRCDKSIDKTIKLPRGFIYD